MRPGTRSAGSPHPQRRAGGCGNAGRRHAGSTRPAYIPIILATLLALTVAMVEERSNAVGRKHPCAAYDDLSSVPMDGVAEPPGQAKRERNPGTIRGSVLAGHSGIFDHKPRDRVRFGMWSAYAPKPTYVIGCVRILVEKLLDPTVIVLIGGVR